MKKPLFELINEQEFTNRTEELEYFWKIAMKAKKNMGSSHALIGRKGLGKTAILMRLYNDLFTKQDEVVPFFLTFAKYKQERLSITKFNEYYFMTVMKQYIAFRLRKPEMVVDSIDMDILYDLAMKNGMEELEKWFTSYQRLYNDSIEAVRDMVTNMTFVLMHEKAGLLIVDEFQVLTRVWDETLGLYSDITSGFQLTAEARWCPMIVSGSAVSLTEKTVFTGLLTRRFRLRHLEPFEENHTIEYASKLAYLNKLIVSDEVLSTLHRLTGGNPFYIWCLLNSQYLTDNQIATPEKLLTLYEYEISQNNGELRDFWDSHFSEYADKLNSEETISKTMYFLSLHPGEDIGTHEVAEAIGEETYKTKKILQNLYDADLVERNSLWRYVGITDPVLSDYIKRVYKEQIEKQSSTDYKKFLKEEYWKKLGSLNQRIGEMAELYIMMLLEKFNHQQVDAKRAFGLEEEEVTLPVFQGKIEKRTGSIKEGIPIEFDLIAKSEEETWIVEVKYWKKPVGEDEIDKFLLKLAEINQETSKTTIVWFFSRNGFEKRALDKLKAQKMRHSDAEGFDYLADMVGCVRLPPMIEAAPPI